MGLNLDEGDRPPLVPTPGPGTEVPKLLTLIGAAWATWMVWAVSGRFARRLPTRLPALLSLASLLRR